MQNKKLISQKSVDFAQFWFEIGTKKWISTTFLKTKFLACILVYAHLKKLPCFEMWLLNANLNCTSDMEKTIYL